MGKRRWSASEAAVRICRADVGQHFSVERSDAWVRLERLIDGVQIAVGNEAPVVVSVDYLQVAAEIRKGGQFKGS